MVRRYTNFFKKSDNRTDKVKIKKPANECTNEVPDRAGYLHILALDVLLYEFYTKILSNNSLQ